MKLQLSRKELTKQAKELLKQFKEDSNYSTVIDDYAKVIENKEGVKIIISNRRNFQI